MENSSELPHLTRRTAVAPSQQSSTHLCQTDNKLDSTPHNNHERITFRTIQILLGLVLMVLVILAVSVSYQQLASYKKAIMVSHPHTSSKFRECVGQLIPRFPNQDPLLWRQIVKHYNFNQERRRTVLCQTFITHGANRDPLDCLIKQLSACLDPKGPYVFRPASDPIQSASQLERDLNSTDRQVGYFRDITALTHPIPSVFHAICDPDHSPYKERVFFFTISSDTLNKKSADYSHRDVSNAITEVLNKYWITRDGSFPPGQIASVISHIADTAYYFSQEGNIRC